MKGLTEVFNIPTTVDVPDGVYTAMLEEVEEGDGSFGKYRKWHFLVDVPSDKLGKPAGTVEIVPLSALTSINTGPQSKSYKWLTALLGGAPQAGTAVASPNGSRAVVTVTHNDKNFPTISDVGPYVDPVKSGDGIPR